MVKRKKRKKIILVIVIILIIIFLISEAFNIRDILMKKIYRKEYVEFVEKYSTETQNDPLLIYAIIKAESNFKSDAISSSGAIGLMQLMESTAKDISKSTEINFKKELLLDSEINIRLGTKYFSNLLKKYSNVPVALTAYNAGSGNVDRWIEQGIIKSDGSNIEQVPYRETNNYVRKILRDYEIYKELYT